MNPTRQRRLVFVVSVLVAVTAAVGLALFALSRNMSYLFTPSQVEAGQARGYRSFRLGGMVEAGSIRHDENSLEVHFTVVDAGGSMPVVYDGILPDLFRANQAVIATGHMDDGHFVATQVLAKHDATYMPLELKEAMARAHGRRPGFGMRDSGFGNARTPEASASPESRLPNPGLQP